MTKKRRILGKMAKKACPKLLRPLNQSERIGKIATAKVPGTVCKKMGKTP